MVVRAYREGASVASLDGDPVAVDAVYWPEEPERIKGVQPPPPEPIDSNALADELRTRLRHGLGNDDFAIEKCGPAEWGDRVQVRVRTTAPAAALVALDAHAREAHLSVWLGVEDVEPLERAVRRLLADVAAIEKARR